MKPTVLLACTSRWFPASRLAIALTKAGFSVEAVCPSHHSLAKLRCVRRTYSQFGFFSAESVLDAIQASKPDLIVPCDDAAVQRIHRIYAMAARRKWNAPICSLIERSLGSPDSFSVLYRRAAFLERANEEGVRVPATRGIAHGSELERWAGLAGFPLVLKADNTSGGEGVRIVDNCDEAMRAFDKLSSPPLVARAIKRAIVDQDATLITQSLLRRRSTLCAQSFIRGREATSLVACWRGTTLASIHFEVVNKTSSTGHSTVLRLMENPEVSAATETVVRRFGLSGVIGFDFILEGNTGDSYLIEINPRATQVGHLTLGPGKDIPAALFSAVTGQPVHEAVKVTENEVIALFPQEWKRDPSSPHLRSGYHDVPWDEPELIRACVRRRRKQWAWYAQQEELRGLSPAGVQRP